jgi:cobalt/nickel transport system permease protein
MRRATLDFYLERPSPVHRLPAPFKLSTALMLVFCSALTPRGVWPYLLGVFAGLLMIIPLAQLSFRTVAKRLLLLEPVAAGMAVLALLQPHGSAIFLSLIVKSSVCLLTMILLTGTTPFSALLATLTAWHVPRLLITTLNLLYRYLFVLLDELTRMQLARHSRTFIKRRSYAWILLSTLAAQLFVRSSLRAERVYAAMCARGWKP